jgi:nucleotidyltransferase substrate binding protein (TIGR01987 family)
MAILNLAKLKKAQEIFEDFRKDMVDDRDKAGAIQAFEFCYELAWKVLKRVLQDRGQETGSPRDTFRKAGVEGLLHDPEVWFMFQQKRNLTVHTYERQNLDEVVATFGTFSLELEKLVHKLENLP